MLESVSAYTVMMLDVLEYTADQT